ncbi:hypothetical protein HMSSN139_31820 [Paenibacillus sp. HMSSN-139]|nr:hypothetical protein HMSSN139_31820 [Paenibacillus sp. HMSSN-139]
MSDKIYIGVDLGGTAVKVGICNEEGQLLHTYEGPTEVDKGADTIVANIEKYVRRVVEESPFAWEQVAGVGAAWPGLRMSAKGSLFWRRM